MTDYKLCSTTKYSTSLLTIVLVVFTTANFGGLSNFCRYYTQSQTGKSTGYRPTEQLIFLFSVIFYFFIQLEHGNHVTRGMSTDGFEGSSDTDTIEYTDNDSTGTFTNICRTLH
jgi:hypothetical protein